MLKEIDAFLRRTGMPPATLGRAALGDPRLVFDLRKGRNLRLSTVKKIREFISANNG